MADYIFDQISLAWFVIKNETKKFNVSLYAFMVFFFFLNHVELQLEF